MELRFLAGTTPPSHAPLRPIKQIAAAVFPYGRIDSDNDQSDLDAEIVKKPVDLSPVRATSPGTQVSSSTANVGLRRPRYVSKSCRHEIAG
jgi:hypothetical protein